MAAKKPNSTPDPIRETPGAASRRDFVRSFSLWTASAWFLGKSWNASVLAAAQPSNVGLLQVKISDYPPLAQTSGSIRIGLVPSDERGPLGDFYPIIINRGQGTTFYVLDSACRHEGCVVRAYDVEETAIVCPCHNSKYALDGTVTNGPATSSLAKYQFSFDGIETLTIRIPNFQYRVSVVPLTASSQRLRLEFPTSFNVEYEVRRQLSVTSSSAVIPFSLSPGGPLKELSLIGDGSPAVLYVDRAGASAFFSVAVKMVDMT